jgi:hypothetical protein
MRVSQSNNARSYKKKGLALLSKLVSKIVDEEFIGNYRDKKLKESAHNGRNQQTQLNQQHAGERFLAKIDNLIIIMR